MKKAFIKRLWAVVLCMALCLTAVCPEFATEANSDIVLTGDINNDGALDGNDLIALQKALLLGEYEYEKELYDVKADGSINILDFIRLKKLITYFVNDKKFTANEIETVYLNEAVSLGELFSLDGEYTVKSEDVQVVISTENCTYGQNITNWASGSLTFAAIGEVSVTIYEWCQPTTITFNVEKKIVEKFRPLVENGFTVESGNEISFGSLFAETGLEEVNDANVQINVDTDVKTDTFVQDFDNWENTVIEFNGTGNATITISEDSLVTTLELSVSKTLVDKFVVSSNFSNYGSYLYRVGNANTVALGSIFSVFGDYEINSETVEVTVSADENSNVSGAYTANTTDWTKGTIKFSGTGPVSVTIKEDYSNEFTIRLEVVDATNATSAANATKNNVVLLNDCGFSSLEVSGGYTLYGNGFTLTCGSDSASLDMGYGFVTLNNGTLDNVQIVCPNYDYAALYKTNLTSSENRSETTDKTRYYNAKSGVMALGNSQILNSRISGGRASLNVSGGNIVVDNSRIELGAVASILVGSANSLVLKDTTLVQKPTVSTHDSNKTLMGFSVLYLCDSEGNAAPTTIEGSFVQQAWIDESDSQYVPSAGESIISAVLAETDYLHDIDGDGENESLNLGFAYMPEELTSSVSEPTNITDNRTDKVTIPYEMKGVSVRLAVLSTTVYVYSYKNTNGTADSFKTETEYKPNTQGDIVTVTYSDTSEGLTNDKSFGTNGWIYELNVDLDKLSGYKLDFSKLSMTVNGITVTDFKVNGGDKPTSPIAVTAGGTTYKLTATVGGKEYTATYKVTGTETSKESPSLVASNYEAGFGVANKYGGDWSAAAPVLNGITIKYWSVADSEYKEFALSSITFANTGKQNGTNNYWEYTHTNNDFTLKLTNTVVIHSGSSTYGMPVAGKDGKLYFTISSSVGFVSTGTTSRSITIAYEFTDNNGGDTLKFTHTWSIPYSKDEQYNYSSFTSDGTLTKLESSSGGSTPCFTPDTLITLSDGSQKRVNELSFGDKILAWDFFSGSYVEKDISLLVNHGANLNNVIYTKYSDGTLLKLVGEHGVFDFDLNKFVYITANNVTDYIGHRFVKQNLEDGYDIVTMTEGYVIKEYVEAWSVSSSVTSNAFASGLLTVAPPEDFYNWVEMDEKLHYDVEQFMRDVETYGLYTYEDFKDYVTYEQFVAWNGAYLKIPVEKGYFTFDYILELIELYKGWMPQN